MRTYTFKKAVCTALIAGHLFTAVPAYSQQVEGTHDAAGEMRSAKSRVPSETILTGAARLLDIEKRTKELLSKAGGEDKEGLEKLVKAIESVKGSRELAGSAAILDTLESRLLKYEGKYARAKTENQNGGLAQPERGEAAAGTHESAPAIVEEPAGKREEAPATSRGTDAPRPPLTEPPAYVYPKTISGPDTSQFAEDKERAVARAGLQGEYDAIKVNLMVHAERGTPHKYFIGDAWVSEMDILISSVKKHRSELSGDELSAYLSSFLRNVQTDTNTGSWDSISQFDAVIGYLDGLNNDVRALLASLKSYSEAVKGTIEITGYTDAAGRLKARADERYAALARRNSGVARRVMEGLVYEGECTAGEHYVTVLERTAQDNGFLRGKSMLLERMRHWLPMDDGLKRNYRELDGAKVYSLFNSLDLRTQKEIVALAANSAFGNDALAALIYGLRDAPHNYAPLLVKENGGAVLTAFEPADVVRVLTYISGWMRSFDNARDIDGLNAYVRDIKTKISEVANRWNIHKVMERSMEAPKTGKIGPVDSKEYDYIYKPAARISFRRYLTDVNTEMQDVMLQQNAVIDLQRYFDLTHGPVSMSMSLQESFARNMGPITAMHIDEPAPTVQAINFDLDIYRLAPRVPPRVGDIYAYYLGGEASGNSYSYYTSSNSGRTSSSAGQGALSVEGGVTGAGVSSENHVQWSGTWGGAAQRTENAGGGSRSYSRSETSNLVEVTSHQRSIDMGALGFVKEGDVYIKYSGTSGKEKTVETDAAGNQTSDKQKIPGRVEDVVALSFENVSPGGALSAMVFDQRMLARDMFDENGKLKKEFEHRTLTVEMFHKRDNVWVYAGSYEITPRQVEQLYAAWHTQWTDEFSTRVYGAGVIFFEKDLFTPYKEEMLAKGYKEGYFQGTGASVEYWRLGFGAAFEDKAEIEGKKHSGRDKGLGAFSYNPEGDKERIWVGMVYANPEYADRLQSQGIYDAVTYMPGQTDAEKSIGVRPSMSKEQVIGSPAEDGAALKLIYAESAREYGTGFLGITAETLRAGALYRGIHSWGNLGAGAAATISDFTKENEYGEGGAAKAHYATRDYDLLALASIAGQAATANNDGRLESSAGVRYLFELWGAKNSLKVVEAYEGSGKAGLMLAGAEVKRGEGVLRLYYVGGGTVGEASAANDIHLFGASGRVGDGGRIYLEGMGGISGLDARAGLPAGSGVGGKVIYWGEGGSLHISPALQSVVFGDVFSIGSAIYTEYGNLRAMILPLSFYMQFNEDAMKSRWARAMQSYTFESSFRALLYLYEGQIEFGATYLIQTLAKDYARAGSPFGIEVPISQKMLGEGDSAQQVFAFVKGGQRGSLVPDITYWDIGASYRGWWTKYAREHELTILSSIHKFDLVISPYASLINRANVLLIGSNEFGSDVWHWKVGINVRGELPY
ncbi:MAG: hypothetical protein QXU54_03525 [Candidatus Micrarchaeia archaeon]